jgi:hypothetical protein
MAKTDVTLYNATTGTLYTGISDGIGGFTYQYHLVSQTSHSYGLATLTATEGGPVPVQQQ